MDIPTTTFGKTGVQVSVIAQGGARMEVHDLGVTCFDCARLYWNGRSEEA